MATPFLSSLFVDWEASWLQIKVPRFLGWDLGILQVEDVQKSHEQHKVQAALSNTSCTIYMPVGLGGEQFSQSLPFFDPGYWSSWFSEKSLKKIRKAYDFNVDTLDLPSPCVSVSSCWIDSPSFSASASGLAGSKKSTLGFPPWESRPAMPQHQQKNWQTTDYSQFAIACCHVVSYR